MKKLVMLLSIVTIFTLAGCTDLEEGIYGQTIAEDFYATPAGVKAALADVYAEIRGDWGGKGIAGADRGWYDLNEMCTDEMIIPTRSDGAWADNGIWRAMYTHTWTGSQEFIGNTWNWLYRAVFKGNLAVQLLEEAGASEAQIAEAHVLRAYFYYMLIDGWGSVPFYTVNNLTIDQIPQTSREEIFDWIVQELETYVPQLDETIGGEFYGRFNKWAGYALLGKIYLNGEVYTGSPYWQEAVDAFDEIIGSGNFGLTQTLYDNAGEEAIFGDVLSNQEVLLAMFVDAQVAPRNIIGIRTLRAQHSNAIFGFNGWNGACIHQDFYNKYDSEDKRRDQWLLGAQPGDVTYELNLTSLTSAGVNEGARSAKFFPVAPFVGNEAASNDFPIFRYADVLLSKAEALMRLSEGNEALARDLVDDVRNRAGLEDFEGTMTLEEIYDERGRELCWEGHRRQDMIRFGTFLQPHDFKPASTSTYLLFPIPQEAMDENPTLVQNTGYN